jgi:hypothetical protein
MYGKVGVHGPEPTDLPFLLRLFQLHINEQISKTHLFLKDLVLIVLIHIHARATWTLLHFMMITTRAGNSCASNKSGPSLVWWIGSVHNTSTSDPTTWDIRLYGGRAFEEL